MQLISILHNLLLHRIILIWFWVAIQIYTPKNIAQPPSLNAQSDIIELSYQIHLS